ncbi:sigma-70 family RNA polymerase sigma factor [Hyphomicrobium sp. LHD-15]|uniref:sigma-70 family RNA polymerase sigma factor n=1 Tax=Hyphomicrobium sp. LHD-15 TaxID=3072142 RepID=UPI00280E9E2B|nr:sigma-70 family RNA polymerase sigma factor [Hyphomicrobium sp. LHD-15]MDQ8700821.1 sigma-70 family RNA polymerase sigma factor [Hyphomicrobium sp. LHD-15]
MLFAPTGWDFMKSSRQQLDELLAGVARGDEAAFAELYQVTSAKLYSVALRILRSNAVAEDVVQDSYFKIWERARDFDAGIASPITWMAAIVRNRALDEVRRRAVRPAADVSELDHIASDDEHPVEVIGRQEDVARLMRCLEGLEPERQQMVRLAYLDGLSREALAKRFDRPEGTIKTWLHRSLAQLKGCLER